MRIDDEVISQDEDDTGGQRDNYNEAPAHKEVLQEGRILAPAIVLRTATVPKTDELHSEAERDEVDDQSDSSHCPGVTSSPADSTQQSNLPVTPPLLLRGMRRAGDLVRENSDNFAQELVCELSYDI
jgi:hypothetical protein